MAFITEYPVATGYPARPGRPARDAAGERYRQILKQQPDHAYASHLLGADALRRGELDKAIELVGTAIQANAGEPAFHLFLGHEYHHAVRTARRLAGQKLSFYVKTVGTDSRIDQGKNETSTCSITVDFREEGFYSLHQ